MALQNLFDMVKADRYTQDGCEKIIKAKSEIEDVKYNIGDISQKTGLQKTANGWSKPKDGKAAGAGQKTDKERKREWTQEWIKSGMHTGPYGAEIKSDKPPKQASAEINNFMDDYIKRQIEEKAKKVKGGAEKNVYGGEVDKIYERQLKRIKELKAKGFTDEQIDNDKIIKQTKEDMRNVGKKPESKPKKSLAGTPIKQADFSSKDPYEITKSIYPDNGNEAKEMDRISAFMQEETGATLRNAIIARESYYKNKANHTPEDEQGLAALMSIEKKLGYGNHMEDSAPRILTGDTKIRVRKA